MDNDFRMTPEQIKVEVDEVVLPYLKDNDITGLDALTLSVQYMWLRCQDYEWESNDIVMNKLNGWIEVVKSPLFNFERTWGTLHQN